MVCNLFWPMFWQEKNFTSNSLNVGFRNLDRFPAFRVYMYIHELRTVPEYLNHYVHVFDTNKRGRVEIQFSKKIIYRHVNNGASCVDYSGVKSAHRSKDHCLQSCARHLFNINYYKFLYLEGDNVTMFSGTRSEIPSYCFKYCRDRCSTHFFEVVKISSSSSEETNSSTTAESTDLTLLAFPSSTKDSVQIVLVNFGIFAMNILTIIGFSAGFHLYALHNCLQLYVQIRSQAKRWQFKSFDPTRFLFVVLKLSLLIVFVLHISTVFKEFSKYDTFETVITHQNLFVEKIAITFCFKLESLTGEKVTNESLKLYYLDQAPSGSIQEVFSDVEIYKRNQFKDRKALIDFLDKNVASLFYEDKKCFKVNLDLLSLTGIHMNVNIVKYTTLDNQIKFVFAKPYDSVYLSDYNLYPNSHTTFENQKSFKKSIKIFGELFHGKRCLNYTQKTAHPKCGSRSECVENCRVRSLLKRYNIWSTLYKYRNELKHELNITEETNFTRFKIPDKLRDLCNIKFPLPDCKKVVFEVLQSNEDLLYDGHQSSKREFVLKLGFDEEIKQIHYSYTDYQLVNYVINLFFVYFGCSLSGLFSLLERTRLKKLNSMKLLFILVLVYVEFSQLIGLYFDRKLIYATEFDTADSVKIPKATICYPINEILKNGRENELSLSDQKGDDQYFSFLNGRTKESIDNMTKNLTELFHNITFLANNFGAYTTLRGRSLNSLEYLGKSNSLTLESYLFANFKCYAFELKFQNIGQDTTFDLDCVIRFFPATPMIRLYISSHNFLTSKEHIVIRNSTLFKFTHQTIVDKSFEADCNNKAYEKRIKRVNLIRDQFNDGYGCVSTFLTIKADRKNQTICNEKYESVENEIIKSLNQPDEYCECCAYYTFKTIKLESDSFLVALSPSGYKFLKVYRLKLSFYELITYLISVPCFMLGINLFKLIKIVWIRFLVIDRTKKI